MERKEFFTVEGKNKNGNIELVHVYYGTLRRNTTWFAKNDASVSCKINKSKKGVFSYGSGDYKCIIDDRAVIEYIDKDFN